jgi:molybdenum-dependent DNA-binding transcriptional regulator ModE
MSGFDDDSIRAMANIAQAAKDAGIEFEQALRFMSALCLLSEADRVCRGQKPPERAQ